MSFTDEAAKAGRPGFGGAVGQVSTISQQTSPAHRPHQKERADSPPTRIQPITGGCWVRSAAASGPEHMAVVGRPFLSTSSSRAPHSPGRRDEGHRPYRSPRDESAHGAVSGRSDAGNLAIYRRWAPLYVGVLGRLFRDLKCECGGARIRPQTADERTFRHRCGTSVVRPGWLAGDSTPAGGAVRARPAGGPARTRTGRHSPARPPTALRGKRPWRLRRCGDTRPP